MRKLFPNLPPMRHTGRGKRKGSKPLKRPISQTEKTAKEKRKETNSGGNGRTGDPPLPPLSVWGIGLGLRKSVTEETSRLFSSSSSSSSIAPFIFVYHLRRELAQERDSGWGREKCRFHPTKVSFWGGPLSVLARRRQCYGLGVPPSGCLAGPNRSGQ